MLLLIDIFSINRSRGYENPILDIIVIELFSTGGFPLEEAREHFFLNQSVISILILISFQCYCGDCSGYIVVILPFLAFYFCSAYFLYLVYYNLQNGDCWKYYFWIFDDQFGYPIFEGIFTLHTSSNGSTSYMVGNLIQRHFHWHMTFPLTL